MYLVDLQGQAEKALRAGRHIIRGQDPSLPLSLAAQQTARLFIEFARDASVFLLENGSVGKKAGHLKNKQAALEGLCLLPPSRPEDGPAMLGSLKLSEALLFTEIGFFYADAFRGEAEDFDNNRLERLRMGLRAATDCLKLYMSGAEAPGFTGAMAKQQCARIYECLDTLPWPRWRIYIWAEAPLAQRLG